MVKLAVAFKVGEQAVLRGEEGGALLFRGRLTIDADGAPCAYHPDGRSGLDHLANAGRPGRWWGVLTDSGKPDGTPIVQGPDDPCPGFFISPTTLSDKSRPKNDPRRYVDSTQVPYIALPPEVRQQGGVKLGDVALVLNARNGRRVAALFADGGPKGKLGEGSIALAKALGIPDSPRSGGQKDDVIYLVFPGSPVPWPAPFPTIEGLVDEGFARWGGMARLREAFPEYAAAI